MPEFQKKKSGLIAEKSFWTRSIPSITRFSRPQNAHRCQLPSIVISHTLVLIRNNRSFGSWYYLPTHAIKHNNQNYAKNNNNNATRSKKDRRELTEQSCPRCAVRPEDNPRRTTTTKKPFGSPRGRVRSATGARCGPLFPSSSSSSSLASALLLLLYEEEDERIRHLCGAGGGRRAIGRWRGERSRVFARKVTTRRWRSF